MVFKQLPKASVSNIQKSATCIINRKFTQLNAGLLLYATSLWLINLENIHFQHSD